MVTDKSTLRWRSLATVQARLRLQGPDARRFLHGMVSNDVQGLKPGRGCHACLLSVKGKLIGDLAIFDLGDEGLLLSLVAAARDGVYQALDRHLIMDNATLTDASAEVAALQLVGDDAAQFLAAALPELSLATIHALPRYGFATVAHANGTLRVAAMPALGAATFCVFGPSAAVEGLQGALGAAGAAVLQPTDAEIRRVESGLPEYGRDLDEDRMPAEAGLDDAVSFSKGCYMGQEVVVRLRDRGHLNRKLCGLRFDSGSAPPVVGSKLRSADRPQAAVLTSVVQSPRFGTIGLGYVHRAAWDVGTRLEVLGPGDEATGCWATVCAIPFSG